MIVELVLAVLKIAIVIGFCLNMSALATWADRRQSAMIQHRVGPNRAVVHVPSFIVQGLLATPGLLLGGAAAVGVSHNAVNDALVGRIGLGLQLFVFAAWFNLVVLAWRVSQKGALNGVEAAIGSHNRSTPLTLPTFSS